LPAITGLNFKRAHLPGKQSTSMLKGRTMPWIGFLDTFSKASFCGSV
jgi:hypothetical protein